MNGNHRGWTRGKKKKGGGEKRERCVPLPLDFKRQQIYSSPTPTCHIPPPPSLHSIDKGEVKGKDSEKDEEEERHVIDVSITRFVDAVADR